MAVLTIGSLPDFNEATTAYRRSAGRYLIEELPPESGDPGIQDNEADGVDGTGTVIVGFRGRTVGPFVVCYVAASRDACLLAFETDRDAVEAEQVPDGITVTASSGADYENCYLPRGGARALSQPKETEAGTWWMEVVWALEQKRPTAGS